MRGFIFDLDGCVWTGDVLMPGAADVLALLRGQGRALTFLTNNSRARAATMHAKLERLGVQAAVNEVLTPLEILGRVLDTHVGAASRVLAIGGPGLEAAGADGGHSLVPMGRYREAQAVVVGNDFDFSYERLTAASRAVAGGAGFLTPNLHPRPPVGGGRGGGRGLAPAWRRQAGAAAVRAGAGSHGARRGGRGHGGRQRGLGHPRGAARGADGRARGPPGGA